MNSVYMWTEYSGCVLFSLEGVKIINSVEGLNYKLSMLFQVQHTHTHTHTHTHNRRDNFITDIHKVLFLF